MTEEIKTDELEGEHAEVEAARAEAYGDNDIIDDGSTNIESEVAQAAGEQVIVTSVSEEEKKTGKIELTEGQALNLAGQQHTAGMKQFQDIMTKLSVRGLRRVMIALMQLPELDGTMVSYLNSDEEKRAFSIGQMVLNAKFALFTGLVKQRRQLAREEQAKAEYAQAGESEDTPELDAALVEFNEFEKNNPPVATDIAATFSELKQEATGETNE